MTSAHHCSVTCSDFTALTMLRSPSYSSLPLKNVSQGSGAPVPRWRRRLHSQSLLQDILGLNSGDLIETFLFSEIAAGLNEHSWGATRKYVLSFVLSFVR